MKRNIGLAVLALALAVAVLGMPVWHYIFAYNFRTVEAGAFYGSRQMSGSALESAVRKRGIKTVINLRGENPGSPWYDAEVEACKRAGVRLANFRWSRGRLPEPESVAEFVDLIESGEGPFLAHCEGGTHRTGVAAACYLLLKGKTPAVARGEFGPRFKNAPIGQIVDLYEQSGVPFKQWVKEAYPAAYAKATGAPEKTAAAAAPAGTAVPNAAPAR